MSTAATVTRASSPAASPASVDRECATVWRGLVLSGAAIDTASLCAASSMLEPGDADRARRACAFV